MAAMIEAKDAKAILGCDDETLNSHINKGEIRAQRSGGKLMLNAEDVQKLATAADDDDGTIVLTGESDNLQIDLGSVIDDTAATFVPDKSKSSTATRSDSLTFGDELEVISFDEPAKTSPETAKTSPPSAQSSISFEEGNTVEMSFTDQNTAVMSSVDQTAVGTTDPNGYTTGSANAAATGRSESSRRSVRSNRVRAEAPPIHWAIPLLMAVTTLILGLLVLPYNLMMFWPNGDERDRDGNRKRGVDDTFFTSMASWASGFSVEPDSAQFKRMNGEATFTPMSGTEWRYTKYRGEFKDVANHERAKTFVIQKISDDGKQAIAADGKKTYPIVEVKNGDSTDEVVELGFSK